MEPKRVIFISLMICYVGFGVINPVLAPLIREIGLEERHAGWILSASALAMLLIAPVWGRQSDRIGRKPIMIIGLTGFAISLLLFAAFAWLGMKGGIALGLVFTMMLVSRLLFGVFVPALTSSGQALMADLTSLSERSKGMAMVGAATGIGFLIGPAMGAALSGIHLVIPIALAAILSLYGVFIVVKYIPKIQPKAASQRTKMNIRRRGLRPYLIIALCLMSTMVMLQITTGFYLQDKFDLSAKATVMWVGVGLFCIGFTMAFIQMTILRKRSFTPRTLVRIGLPLFCLGLLLLVSINHLAGFVFSFLVLGIAGGFAIPGYTAGISMAADEKDQGAAAGLTAAATGIGSLVAPIIATELYRVQSTAPYWAGIVIVFVLSVYAWSKHKGLTVNQQTEGMPVNNQKLSQQTEV